MVHHIKGGTQHRVHGNDDESGKPRDPSGVPQVLPSTSVKALHRSTILSPTPRTVSICVVEGLSFDRRRAKCTSMVFEPRASASSSQTWTAIVRRATTAGEAPHQQLEDCQLDHGETRVTTSNEELARGRVEDHVSDGEHGHLWPARPALQSADPSEQFTKVERLDEIVVGTFVETGDAVARVISAQ